MIDDANKDNAIDQASADPANANLEKLNKLKNLLQNDKSDLFEILYLKDKITFDNPNEEEEINNNIWQKQYVSIFPESTNNELLNKPNMSMINLLLSSANKYKIKDTEKINKIKNLQDQANNYIKEMKKTKTIEELNNLRQKAEEFKINLNEYFIQKEMKLKNNIKEESEDEDNAANNSIENKNPKIKTHRRKKHKRKEDEYENDFVEDESGSEEESEKIDYNNHVIDLSKKKYGTNIKRIADELQEDAKNFRSTRSRRNVSRKKDNDFIYDDIYAKKNDSNNSNTNSDNEEINRKNLDINEDEDEDYTEEELKTKEKKIRNRANEDTYLNKKVKRKKSNPIESKISEYKKTSSNIVALNSNEENKIKSRKNALANITKILTDNKYLIEEGADFVNALANRVEEDLAKAFPAIDFDYQKTLSNMNKTLKEISKYKRINQMIIKGKVTLFKMAKFQFGDKFIQKLKKIEEGGISKKPSKQKNESFQIKDLLQNSNELYSSINDDNKKRKNDNYRLSLMKSSSGLSYRSLFSQSSFGEEGNSGNYGAENDYYSKAQTGSNSNRYDNDDSLESIEAQDNIKFSPGVNNRSNRDISGNLEEVEHSYDPLNKEKLNYKNIFPILYDPALDISSKEENLSEDNMSSPNMNDPSIILANPPPTGSTLRIFHGKIRLNHNTLDNASLFSTNKYHNFLKFPSFEKELILPSKAKSNEVIPYCLKQLSNNSKLELFGWIEPDINKNQENIEISKFKELIEEFERNEKCSCLVDNKIKLYIFVLGEKDEKLFKKIINESKFENKEVMQNLNNGNKFLVFVLLGNNDYLESESIKKKKKIHPEIIKRIEKSESEDENASISNSKNKNTSVAMEEDDEYMKSRSMTKEKNEFNRNQNIENENNNNNNNEEREEENNDEEDDENYIDKEENEKLKNILAQNDFNTINAYIENNFKDLPLEEMASKLQRFSAENRDKLLEIIKNYSENFYANENQMELEEDNNNNINNMNNVGGDFNNMNQMNQQINNTTGMMPQLNLNNSLPMNLYQNDPALNQLYLNQINNLNVQQQQNNNINNNTNLASMYYTQGMNMYNTYNPNFK